WPGLQGAVMGDLPQPQAERHRPLAQVGVQSAERLQMGLLHHVRRIDAGAQLGVEPQFDELLQVGPVAGEQLVERLAIASLGPLEQALRLRRIRSKVDHRAVSFPTNSGTARELTDETEKAALLLNVRC